MIKIASGGELARFILALKVVLAGAGTAPTMVFDEVDRGIGGAVADAVGDRLARLAERAQVLVVTHSPQVAARGRNHFRIAKDSDGETTRTQVTVLDAKARREEIARMLSGAEITPAARARRRRPAESRPMSAEKGCRGPGPDRGRGRTRPPGRSGARERAPLL